MNVDNLEYFDDLIEEIMIKYSFEYNEVSKIIIDTISKIYRSDYPVVLEDDGLYAVYNDNESFKYSKIKYSTKKMTLIIDGIQKASQQNYLLHQKNKIIDFIKNKKPYLHSRFSHSDNKFDYYDLYFDRGCKYVVKSIQASLRITPKKKNRVYIDTRSFKQDKNLLLCKEHLRFVNISNLRHFTKDLSSEIKEKIGKRVWIEATGYSYKRLEVYIHLPYKNTLAVIEYIKIRYKEVFGLDVVLIYRNWGY